MIRPLRTAATLLPLLAIALVQAGEPVVPQEPAPADAPKIDFAELDADRDGNLSRQEALPTADLHASFDLLDVDRNQALSPTEFARWNRAGSAQPKTPPDPSTAPGGSAGAQHLPDRQ